MKKINLIGILLLTFIFTSCSTKNCKIEERADKVMTGNEKTSSESKNLLSFSVVSKKPCNIIAIKSFK